MVNEQRIFDVMNASSTVYEIAKYQRNYSWGQKNWNELWYDVERMKGDMYDKHFLNTVIIYRNKKTKRVEIVDGQQRIITYAVMCIALKNLCEKKNSKSKQIADKISQLFYEVSEETDNKHLRFILKDYDMPAFNAILNNVPAKELSQSIRSHYIYKAYVFFTRKMEKAKSKRALLDALLKFNVIVLECEDEQEASTTFARINSTGLKMKDYEQVNALVYQKIVGSDLEENEKAELSDRWRTISNNPYYSMDFLLYCRAYADGLIDGERKNNYAKAILLNWEPTKMDVNTIVDTMENMYEFWINPSKDEKIKEFIRVTSFANIPYKDKKYASYAIPMLIIDLLYKTYTNGRTVPKKDCINTLNFAEEVVLGRRLCKNTLNGMYVFISPMKKAINDWLNNGRSVYESFYNNIMNSHIGKDLRMAAPIINEALHKDISPSLMMFILQKINSYLSDGNPTNVDDMSDMTIEHIIPRKLKESVKSIEHLGNLTLLSGTDNSHIRDCDYDIKKDAYLDSCCALNEWFADKETFDESSIERRTNELVDILSKIYPNFVKNTVLSECA